MNEPRPIEKACADALAKELIAMSGGFAADMLPPAELDGAKSELRERCRGMAPHDIAHIGLEIRERLHDRAMTVIREERARKMAAEMTARLDGEGVALPPPAVGGYKVLTEAEIEEQLTTLDALDEAVRKARGQGAPVAALEAMLRRPLSLHGRTLHPLTVSVFIFLGAIDSPVLTGNPAGPLDIAAALLGFQAPEETSAYLIFDEDGVTADKASVMRDAWNLCARLTPAELGAAGAWIGGQVNGVAGLMGEGDGAPSGEEAVPFGGTPAPAPPAG